ncbi:hypothetical protein [Herbaspirillum sp.]|jgi:hypothetical protein|uniref:hypothetical protein n=1 Tax=Herbaspirillum TaxID=963 RepID=UPI002582AC9B|nr:hypothetical protein [Herbaspirillum sp.]MCP3655672.1 hypothetical protein [Herbaspirillum sp.]MCP3945441.1 hypothetical protein [Herbaspirillum sp.]MCP4034042.1 hypothetical protein [Herbaspirillum sp.]MCP4034533.1 hypothetical protein [Herbaspirillum sp.]MCP4554684.1 hypothetical protein [Herbaspirillum sp.]
MSIQSPLSSPHPLPTGHPGQTALFWLATAIGAVLFVSFQLFFYVNDFVRAQGSAPAITFETKMLWMFSAYYGCWIATVLLALSANRAARWSALILGSLLVVLNTLGGIADGLRDGWHIAFSAMFFISLPGVFAIATTWRNLNRKGDGHVDE